MFCYHYGADNAITLNAYEVIPPVVCNLNISYPWTTQQHGITSIQYIGFHHYEGDDTHNTMDVNFYVSDYPY